MVSKKFLFSHVFYFHTGPHADTASGCQNLQCGFRACCRSGEWPLTSDLCVLHLAEQASFHALYLQHISCVNILPFGLFWLHFLQSQKFNLAVNCTVLFFLAKYIFVLERDQDFLLGWEQFLLNEML